MNEKHTIFTARFAATLAASFLLWFSGAVVASPEKASVFYEDALKRFERDDVEGAIVQLKNSIQQSNRLLAAHMLLGRALTRNGDLRGAEAAFEEALKQGVNRAEVALPLGRIYIALGKPGLAIERFSLAGVAPAQQVSILVMRGSAYFELGNAREAARAFEEARRLAPDSPIPLIEEIPVLLLQGQRERARSYAARAVQMDPKNAQAWNMQASVLHDALDMNAALAAYGQALALESRLVDARVARAGLLFDLKRDAEAVKDLDFLESIAPEEPRASYLRAMLAAKKGDASAARKHLRDVAGILDALPPNWIVNREQLLMLAALAHHGLGNLQKSREYLDVIIGRNASNDAANRLLAAILVQRGEFGRALPLLEALNKRFPEDPQILFQMGSVYNGQGRFLLATQLLERSAARSPTAEVRRALASAQMGLGKDDVAQATLEKLYSENPRDTESGMALATLQRRRGESRKSLATAESMLRTAPANLALINFLGAVKGANGDRVGARAEYERALARNPAFRPALLNLVKLDVSEGRFDDSRQRLTKILTKEESDTTLLYELGMLEQQAGRPADAIRHFKKASEAQKRDTRPGLALVDILIGQRKVEEAVAAAKELASKLPDDLGVQLALARAVVAMGDRSAARSALLAATRMAEFEPDIQVLIGRMQLQIGNAEGAAYSVQKALQGRPDDVGAMVLAVEVESQRKDAAKADVALKALTAKHPNRIETLLITAGLAMARGQFQSAITNYRAVLAREESTGVVLQMVRAHFAAGEAAKAVAFLESWTAKRPRDGLALKALAEAHFRVGQLASARQSYLRVLQTEPGDAETLNNFANLLLKLGDPEAQAAAEKAVKAAPDNPMYADTLGWILVQKGQPEAGLRYLREARLRRPENAEIRFHLAVALTKIGRTAEAREEMTVAMKSGDFSPNDVAVSQLRKELGL